MYRKRGEEGGGQTQDLIISFPFLSFPYGNEEEDEEEKYGRLDLRFSSLFWTEYDWIRYDMI